jgi:poly(A) polymerase
MESKTLAQDICDTLKAAGFTAYFAGGWVRDYLMGHPSSDVDIATDASPEEIQKLFPRTIPVGIAFGVIIVVHKGHQFEVSTFRTDFEYSGRKPAKIVKSTPDEDAKRRDFTINGMFYNPLQNEVIDYVGGREDLEKQVVRAIGNASERFFEDRLRMIRAVRFASRFGFSIDPETEKGIIEHAHTLFPAVAVERVYQEFCKMAEYSGFNKALIEMHRLGLLQEIFPSLASVSLDQIKDRVAPIAYFPKNYPAIVAILELFPDSSLEEQLEIVRFLRAGTVAERLIEYIYQGKRMVDDETRCPFDWSHFYANTHAKLCIDVIAARLKGDAHTDFLEHHASRMESLLPHSQRIAEKTPLITGKMLKEMGIDAGKQMGVLVKEAEYLAITHDLHTSEEILEILKKSPNWPLS